MQEVINRILEGNFTSETSALDFSCTKIEVSLASNCDYEGSFHIYAAPNSIPEGFVTSTDARMELLNDSLTGADTEIFFHFRGDLCEEGDVIKGSFCIVSNQGEYYIPFTIAVEHPVMESSIGPIRNLFHFANLAKTNWGEAVNLFYSPAFAHVFSGSDASYKEMYRALSANRGNAQNVEEFLICINKKSRVEYVARTKELSINLTATDHGGVVFEREIEIIRNGWGYTCLDIVVEGDFLFTQRKQLNDDHFLGNICNLKVFIDPSVCGHGKHFGKIILKNSFSCLEIPVEVSAEISRVEKKIERNRRNIMKLITMEFINFRLKKENQATWLKNSGKQAEQMLAMDDDDLIARLYQAHILITEDRKNEAGWILDQAADGLEAEMRRLGKNSEELDLPYCYHWYLTTLVHTDPAYAREAAGQVEAIYRKHPDAWQIGWFLLYLPSPYSENLVSQWEFLSDMFQRGCTSPLIYMEGMMRLNQNSTLIRRLDSFALQVLLYGSKQQMIGPAVLEQLLYLCSKVRDFERVLLKTLQNVYSYHEDKRVLQEICSQLIKGNCKDKRSLEWYRKGVEEQLRLTNLFEFFVLSLDMDVPVPIPKTVLLYFSYQNSLDYEHMAYLYRYLLMHRREHEEILENNRAAMETFALEQMRKGRINRHLAVIYEEVLTPKLLDRNLSMQLADLLFSNWLRAQDRSYVKAYVYQEGCDVPWEYDLKDGQGWVAIYGSEYTIVLEDEKENRYLRSSEYSLEKLMLPGKYLRTVSDYVWDNTRFNMYLCSNEHGSVEVTAENVMRFLHLSEAECLEAGRRREAMLSAMRFYFSTGDDKSLARMLSRVRPEELDFEQKQEIFRYLLSENQVSVALEWVHRFGPYFAEAKYMQRLMEKVFAGSEAMDPADCLWTCGYVFKKGKADSAIVKFLSDNYQGLTRDMRDLWKACGSFGIERTEIGGRILSQILFSHAYVGEQLEIFREYAKTYPQGEITRAFLNQCAYDYFACEKLMNDDIFQQIQLCREANLPVPRISKLAFLKYYAENMNQISDRERAAIVEYLHEMTEEQIHLGFFMNFLSRDAFPGGEYRVRLEKVLECMSDRTVIDYRAHAGSNARIHYMMVHENGEAQEYMSEYMRDVGGGVCFHEFVLFFGESLQYYITEEDGTNSSLTQSGSLQKSDISESSGSTRYEMINDMLISSTLQDYSTLDSLLEEYYRREFLNKELFRLQ